MAKQKETQPEPNMEEKILAAAEKLFFRNGYSSTSTTEIAREAGCNQALVHYYFRTKEKLFHTVLGGKVRDVFRELLFVETGEGNFEQKLTKLIETHFDIVRENADMIPFLINECRHDIQIFENIISGIGDMPIQMLALFQKELDAEIEAGRIRPVSIRQLLLNVISINAFAFAIAPLYAEVWGMESQTLEDFFDERRKEVVETILKSLRP